MAARVRSISTAERFWAKVDKSGECWLWTAYLKPNGYATFYPGGGRHVDKVYVHRWIYEYTFGEIPAGMEIDHLCNVRHCVKPAHLEAVTKRVNLDRRNEANGWEKLKPPGPRVYKSHCKRGHAYDDENTYWHAGYRHCRTCRAAASKRAAA